MKIVLLNFAFLLICRLAFSATDNLHIADSLLADIASSELSGVGDTIIVYLPNQESEIMRYSAYRISSALQQDGKKVFRSISAPGNIIAEISNVKLTIAYSEPESDSIMMSDSVFRMISLQVDGELSRAQGREVLRTISATRSYQDKIKYNDIEELEASSFSFTLGKRSSYSFWDRMIEPVLITGSVIAVILLFFTQRA